MGCHSKPHDVEKVDTLPDIYPDYVGVTVPEGIAPLNFSMAGDGIATIDVTIKGSNKGTIHTVGDYADFDIDEWHELLTENKGGKLLVTVCAEKDGAWKQYREFPIYVSSYSLEEWGITYRLIPPSFEVYSKMGLFQRNLSNFDETAILMNTQSKGMCINCHTANKTNPEIFVFHVRGPHGATVFSQNGETELLKARNDSLGGSMVYPYWHPSGRYCAFSTNFTMQMFHLANNKRIEVYDTMSDVFVYDVLNHTVIKDTLTMAPGWSENCPAFSPDGKWLYFTTARSQYYPENYDKERYSLCRISFDAEKGKLGQKVDTLINAEALGKSITWPRPSYDGRYLMYTQLDYGYFSVWHPEADQWLYDTTTGETRLLKEVNSESSESFHNWNINSHWFLFTSRRGDGLYTRVYFSSIDEKGNVTKPFLLPQRNPKEYYSQLLYSYNTPDFTTSRVNLDSRRTGVEIDSGQRVNTTVK